MKPSPIMPSAAPQSAVSSTNASATQTEGASQGNSTNGETFNDLLARQMAGLDAKDMKVAPTAFAAVTDGAQKSSESGSEPGKTDDKTSTVAPDPSAGVSVSGIALIMMPLSTGQTPAASALAGQATSASPLLSSGFQGGSTPALQQPAIAATDQASTPFVAVEALSSRSLEQVATQGIAADNAAPDSLQTHDSRQPDVVPAQALPPAQAQLLASQASPAGPASAQSISTPVGSSRWGDELGQKITWMTTQTDHSAELHLNPPDLGPLKVVLHVSGDQATAMFTSPHEAVRDAVTQALPRLRDMLADNGIMLGNASVSDQGRQDAQGGFSGGGRQSAESSGDGVIEVSSVSSGARSGITRVSQGLVDTFA